MPFVYSYERYKNEPKIFEMVVTGDTNDADYVTETSDISQLEIDEIIKPALELIEANDCRVPFSEYRNKWPSSFEEEEELIKCFEEFCPYGEHGIHKIASVVYYLKPEKIKLL